MTVPSLQRSIAIGAIGFGLASLCVFATVAFAERWMVHNLGLMGAYVAWTVLFIVLAGAVFGSLVDGRWRLPKFYLLFGLAFFAYAAAWVIAYFGLGRLTGEVVGSIAGSILMAIVFALGFGALRSIVKLSAVLFAANFVGYFLGSALFFYLSPPSGMLLFGAVYGLIFGAGIGAVLYLAQSESFELKNGLSV